MVSDFDVLMTLVAIWLANNNDFGPLMVIRGG